MNISIEMLEQAGASEAFIIAVVKIAEAASRERNRLKVSRWRAHRVTDVTSVPVTAVTVVTEEKKESTKERKEPLVQTSSEHGTRTRARTRSRTALPPDFTLSEEERGSAMQAGGWDTSRLETELAKFKDYAIANGKLYADWHAAWRNWVRSPFQAGGQASLAARPGGIPRPGQGPQPPLPMSSLWREQGPVRGKETPGGAPRPTLEELKAKHGASWGLRMITGESHDGLAG